MVVRLYGFSQVPGFLLDHVVFFRRDMSGGDFEHLETSENSAEPSSDQHRHPTGNSSRKLCSGPAAGREHRLELAIIRVMLFTYL